MIWLAINPEFDGLRGDTRFTALFGKDEIVKARLTEPVIQVDRFRRWVNEND